MVRIPRLTVAMGHWVAVVAASALLLVPMSETANADIPHPHAMLLLLVDGVDGSYDHHRPRAAPAQPDGDDASHGASAADPSTADVEVVPGVPGPSAPAPPASAGGAVADSLRPPGASASNPGDLPTASSLMLGVAVGALPLADLRVAAAFPVASIVLLTWALGTLPAGASDRPLFPPPRSASTA